MAVPKVPPPSAVGQLAQVLDSPEIAALVSELEATRWTGRPGYPVRSMVGMALAKSLYAIPTWTKTVALVREHVALRLAICNWGEDVPSVYACYRFAAKLRTHRHLLDACLDRVTAALHKRHPEMGANVAIDGSDMPAYANGQRYLSKNGPERERYSDPDASWGAPLRRLDTQGRRLLRLQGPRSRLHRNWPAARVDRPNGTGRRADARARADRRGQGARVQPGDGDHGQGLRHRPDPRRLHGPWHLPCHAARQHGAGEAR